MTTAVGIREFRAGLAQYIDAEEPVAVTRHGVTIGWFIPTPASRDAHIESLRSATAVLDKLLADNAVEADEVVSEFDAARRAR